MADSLEALSRAQLQERAKGAGIPANITSVAIIEELRKPGSQRRQTQRIQRAAARKTRKATRARRPPATPRLMREVACVAREAQAKYQVGTSGFMVSKATWLKLPCLNCIEINSTFYHLPQESTVARWNELPPHVGVVIKASKYITHMKRLHDVKEAWDKLWALISPLGPRLRCVLFQLPPSFKMTTVNLERVAEMKSFLPEDLTVAFEFRDVTWFQPLVYSAMRKLNFCMVGTFIKKAEGSKWLGTMPKGLLLPPRTASISYLRIHGGRGYRGALTKPQLEEIRNGLAEQGARHSFVMFNNTFFDRRGQYCDVAGQNIKYAAVCNAAEFTSLLTAPGSLRVQSSPHD
jgi:uncharacterized protein YecE (DUF72 family)